MDWFDRIVRKQNNRINERLKTFDERLERRRQQRRVNGGGQYALTIRGAQPAQIALEQPPDELLLKEGEIGRRTANGLNWQRS